MGNHLVGSSYERSALSIIRTTSPKIAKKIDCISCTFYHNKGYAAVYPVVYYYTYMPRREKVQSAHTSFLSKYGFVISIVGIGLVVVGGAVFLGKSDSGQIDVTEAIESANQIRRESGDVTTEQVNAIPEVFKNKTNGGLVPQEAPAETPAEVVADTTSTSTEEGEAMDAEPAIEEAESVETESVEEDTAPVSE